MTWTRTLSALRSAWQRWSRRVGNWPARSPVKFASHLDHVRGAFRGKYAGEEREPGNFPQSKFGIGIFAQEGLERGARHTARAAHGDVWMKRLEVRLEPRTKDRVLQMMVQGEEMRVRFAHARPDDGGPFATECPDSLNGQEESRHLHRGERFAQSLLPRSPQAPHARVEPRQRLLNTRGQFETDEEAFAHEKTLARHGRDVTTF